MKIGNILTLVFAVVVLALLIVVLFFLPEKPGDNESSSKAPSSSRPTVAVASEVSKEEIKAITAKEFIERCDTVITGQIIKAVETDIGTDYAFSVGKVYKGRNYTPNGYASVKGDMKISLADNCLFLGNKVDAKENRYDYTEPFEDAPWVFRVNGDGSLTHISGGNLEFCKELETLKIEDIKELCKKK